MEKQIYQTIQKLASELVHHHTAFTRADLAYELKKFGIEKDSIDVSRLVWEAYHYYNKDIKIKKAFINNEKKQSIIDEYQICQLVEESDASPLFTLFDQKLNNGKKSVKHLQMDMNKSLELSPVQKIDLRNTIIGTKGVVEVKAEAIAIFNTYTNLITSYDRAKDDTKAIMADFVFLREKVADIYRQYSIALVDIFGDSIKAISPELFDFDSIQWLDVAGMLQAVKLEYDNLSNTCAVLTSEIQESFRSSLQGSVETYSRINNKKLALVMSGINMVSHYLDAQNRTLLFQQDLVTLKDKIKYDVATIKGDGGRLLLIYKTMNDLHIPRAKAFYKYGQQVLSSEFTSLLDSLYQRPEIRSLKQQRDEILLDYKQTEKALIDAQLNINSYVNNIAAYSQLLENEKSDYQQALNSKPSRPNFLLNLFSFGSARTRYNREIYEWNEVCAPLVERYKELLVDVDLDKKELETLRADLKRHEVHCGILKANLKKLNREILNKIRVEPEIKLKVANRLESLIQFLRIAKEIVSSKLDTKLIHTVEIPKYESLGISLALREGIQSFANSLRQGLEQDEEEEILYLKKEIEEARNRDTNTLATDKAKEELTIAEQMKNKQIVSKTVDVFESWANLKLLQTKQKLTQEIYDFELQKLREKFKKNMADIDNKGFLLGEALRKMNTSQSMEELKEGLLMLTDIKGLKLTEEDFEQFLNGTKIIEI